MQNELEPSCNQPPPRSLEKLSSAKLIPGTKRWGTCVQTPKYRGGRVDFSQIGSVSLAKETKLYEYLTSNIKHYLSENIFFLQNLCHLNIIILSICVCIFCFLSYVVFLYFPFFYIDIHLVKSLFGQYNSIILFFFL